MQGAAIVDDVGDELGRGRFGLTGGGERRPAEVEVGDLGQKLGTILDEMRSHSHGMRHAGAPIQVFVYFSVAGGTGSGAFLPFAYLCRDFACQQPVSEPEALYEQIVGRPVPDGMSIRRPA